MRRSRTAGGVDPCNPTMATQIAASQTVSFRVRAPSPKRTPKLTNRRSVGRAPRGSRASRVMTRHAARTITVNGIVESGSAELSTSGR